MSTGEKKWLGLHLGGVNTPRSAVVVINLKNHVPQVANILEKIGPLGNVGADERILEIISQSGVSDVIFIDAPLASPPCVSCLEPVCPGAMACSDVRVAYISALAAKAGHRRRPIDPQAHRVWDVMQMQDRKFVDPTYSSSQSALVIRAQVLEKRLRSLNPRFRFKETHVPLAVLRLSSTLKIPQLELKQFRKFENGLRVRQRILTSFLENQLVAMNSEDFAKISGSLEVFQAFLCAWLCVQDFLEFLQPPPKQYPLGEPWVWLPRGSAS